MSGVLHHLTIIVTLGVLAQTAFAQVELKVQFQQGQTQAYRIKQDITTTMMLGQQQMVSKMNQQTDMVWNAKQVLDNGSAVMEQTIRRIVIDMTLPPPLSQNVIYDTANPKPIPGPLAAMSSQFDNMVDAPCQLIMSPSGQISQVKLSPKFEAISQNGQMGMVVGGADKMRQLIEQASLPLPEGPVSVGEQWKRTVSIDAPFGTMQTLMTYTYKGPQPEGLHKIAISSQVRVIPGQNSMADVTISSSQGSGHLLFDNNSGYLKESSLNQIVGMTITAGGQTIEQTVDSNVKMSYLNN